MSALPSKSYTGHARDNLYYVTVMVQNAHGGMTPIEMISDSGNQSTILKREVADQLGLDLSQGEPFMVGGINGEAKEFRRFKLWIKIGQLEPIRIKVGFATTPDGLIENLLGNEDILTSGKYEARYDKNGVTFVHARAHYSVSESSGDGGQRYLNNLYGQLKPNGRCSGYNDARYIY